jgi:hypothetical protein
MRRDGTLLLFLVGKMNSMKDGLNLMVKDGLERIYSSGNIYGFER